MIPILIDLRQHPLRRAAKNGDVYVRRPLVTSQIESLREIEERELMHRISVRQEEEDNSFKSETLVFLFRALRKTFGEPFLTHVEDEIGRTLFERIARIVGPFRRDFDGDPNKDERYEDFRLAVVAKFFEKTCNPATDDADYAEVSFGQFVVGLARNEIKKYFNEKKKAAQHDDLTRFDTMDAPAKGFYSRDISLHSLIIPEQPIEDRAALLKSALEVLSEPARTAWVLRYAEDWQIEGSEDGEPTLAGYFGVSGRTIRNWLSAAEKKLKNRMAPAE